MAIDTTLSSAFWAATPAQKAEAELRAELDAIDKVMGWTHPTKEPGWRATRLREMLAPGLSQAQHMAYMKAVTEAEASTEVRREAAKVMLAVLPEVESERSFRRLAKAIALLLNL